MAVWFSWDTGDQLGTREESYVVPAGSTDELEELKRLGWLCEDEPDEDADESADFFEDEEAE